MSLPPDLSQPHCEVGEDTLSSIDGSSMIGSSVSKYVSAFIIRIPSKCCFRYITESEEESSTDSDDEEAEPKLKYERLSRSESYSEERCCQLSCCSQQVPDS